MRKPILLCLMMGLAVCALTSCNDKNDQYDDVGSSSILAFTVPEQANMGDSIELSFKLEASVVKANQAKLQVYYEEGKLASERVLLTDQNGEYKGKVLFPFIKNLANGGEVIVKLRTQNERFANDVREIKVVVNRPNFPKLLLHANNGKAYEMLPTGNPFEYSVRNSEIPVALEAYIEAPKYQTNGNAIIFGNVDGKVTTGVDTGIEFTLDPVSHEVKFNTETFDATPAVKFTVNGIEFQNGAANEYLVNTQFTKNQEITVTGLSKEWKDYWIDPTWFNIKKGTNRTVLKFRGIDGRYKFTVNKQLKYIRVEVLKAGDAFGTLNSDGTGALWLIGNNNVGKPSYASNNINWATDKAICLCPVEKNVHEMILEKGRTVGTPNFKFYSERGWGGEFVPNKYTSTTINQSKPFFIINTGSSDVGNIKVGSTGLTEGKFYRLKMVMSNGPLATLSAEELDEIPEVE